MPEGVLVTKTREMVGLAGKLGLDSQLLCLGARRVGTLHGGTLDCPRAHGHTVLCYWDLQSLWAGKCLSLSSAKENSHALGGLQWAYLPQDPRTFHASLRGTVARCLWLSSSLQSLQEGLGAVFNPKVSSSYFHFARFLLFFWVGQVNLGIVVLSPKAFEIPPIPLRTHDLDQSVYSWQVSRTPFWQLAILPVLINGTKN